MNKARLFIGYLFLTQKLDLIRICRRRQIGTGIMGIVEEGRKKMRNSSSSSRRRRSRRRRSLFVDIGRKRISDE